MTNLSEVHIIDWILINAHRLERTRSGLGQNMASLSLKKAGLDPLLDLP
jgi:hypothetical protein